MKLSRGWIDDRPDERRGLLEVHPVGLGFTRIATPLQPKAELADFSSEVRGIEYTELLALVSHDLERGVLLEPGSLPPSRHEQCHVAHRGRLSGRIRKHRWA